MSENINIACVRFIEDTSKNEFVDVREIKYDLKDDSHIEPKHATDFEAQHKYEILWCLCKSEVCADHNNEKCFYYKGFIICLGENREEVEQIANSARVRIPKQIFSPSDPPMCSQNLNNSDSRIDATNKKLLKIKQEKVLCAKSVKDAKKRSGSKHLQEHAKRSFLGQRDALNLDDTDEEVNTDINKNKNKNKKELKRNYVEADSDEETEKEKAPLSDVSNRVSKSNVASQSRKMRNTIVELTQESSAKVLDERASISPIIDQQLLNNGNTEFQEQIDDNNADQHRNMIDRRNIVRRQLLFEPRPAINPPDYERIDDIHVTPEPNEVDPNGKNIYDEVGDKIYIGDGKAISKEFWNYLNTKEDYVFVREVSQMICGKRSLVNRCIKPSKIMITLQGRSPRKVITPRKYKIIKGLFQDFCNNKYKDKLKVGRAMGKMNKTIGNKIRDLRNAMYKPVDV